MIRQGKEGLPPTLAVFATTLRQVVSANEHLWGAIMLEGDNWEVIEPAKSRYLIVSAVVTLCRWFASTVFSKAGACEMASVRMGHRCPGYYLPHDYAQPADEDMVLECWKGNARVKR
jgi:2-dehydro-3-deoxygluconokinase